VAVAGSGGTRHVLGGRGEAHASEDRQGDGTIKLRSLVVLALLGAALLAAANAKDIQRYLRLRAM